MPSSFELVGASMQDGRALQMEPVPEVVLDFMRVGELRPKDPFRDVVVKVEFRMKFEVGEEMFWNVVNAVGATWARLCKTGRPTLANVRQDLLSYGMSKVTLDVDFTILPHLGGEHFCADQLALAAWGPAEPPWGMPKPPLRDMIRWTFDLDEDLKKISTADWYMRLKVPTCVSAAVDRPINLEHADEYFIPPGSICGGNPEPPEPGSKMDVVGRGWIDPPDISVDPSACHLSDTACFCAAKEHCAWDEDMAAGGRCIATNQSTNIPCEDCPTQLKCPRRPGDTCSGYVTPCDCAFAQCVVGPPPRRRYGNKLKMPPMTEECCRWQALDTTCVPKSHDEASITSCADCASQAVCEPPRVVGPPQPFVWGRKTTVPSAQYGSKVNVTFDRVVHVATNLEVGVTLHCDPSLEGDENIRIIPIPSSSLVVDVSGRSLFIQMTETRNEQLRQCGLVIAEGTVFDVNGVDFLGMGLGTYYFLLADTVSPTIDAYHPANAARDIQIDGSITVYFTENIDAAPDDSRARAQLVALGAASDDGPNLSSADAVVADVALVSSRVTFKADSVSIALGPDVAPGTFYSLVLPAGCVQDRSGNPFFPGLDKGMYTFQTGHHQSGGATTDSAESNTIAVLIIMLMALLILAVIVASLVAWHRKRTARFQTTMKELSGQRSSMFSWSRGFEAWSRSSWSRGFGAWRHGKAKGFDLTSASLSSDADVMRPAWVVETTAQESSTPVKELNELDSVAERAAAIKEMRSGRFRSYSEPPNVERWAYEQSRPEPSHRSPYRAAGGEASNIEHWAYKRNRDEPVYRVANEASTHVQHWAHPRNNERPTRRPSSDRNDHVSVPDLRDIQRTGGNSRPSADRTRQQLAQQQFAVSTWTTMPGQVLEPD